jgi:hypothetical protein
MNDRRPQRERQLAEVAAKVAGLLGGWGLKPVLVGGAGLVARGLPGATADVDFLVDCPSAELAALADRLEAAGCRLDPLSRKVVRDGVSAELRFFLEDTQVDLIPVSCPREHEVHVRSARQRWHDASLRVACLEDLVIEKLRAGRTAELKRLAETIAGQLSRRECRQARQVCQELGLAKTQAALIEALFGT